jgi:hypothetical protein
MSRVDKLLRIAYDIIIPDLVVNMWARAALC